jgi:hypothetical protein
MTRKQCTCTFASIVAALERQRQAWQKKAAKKKLRCVKCGRLFNPKASVP